MSSAQLTKTDLAPVGKVRQWLTNVKRADRSLHMTKEDYDTVHNYLAEGMQLKLNWFKAVIANIDWEYEKTRNATVRRPVLFIGGTKDYIGIIGVAARQKEYIADLEMIEVDTGHWVMEEKLEQVNREINRWNKKMMSTNSAAASSLLLTSYLCFLILYLFLTI